MKINLIYSSLQVTASLLLVFLLIPAGCGLNTAGHMRHSPVLMEQYREKLLPEELSYFYCGRENLPYAVVGIDPAYTFETKSWFPIKPGPELYRKIDNLSNLEPDQDRMYARAIIGPAGNTIGMWFSFYHSTGVIVDDTNHSIQVYNPYKPESRRHSF
ncbi:hypothetical protein [uncultured Desulfobacter sp.]|uniref:hypothetical protein n=1 Tax=uncultured Desulfobacter sp. TaxID=240139 RepID=UPI0029C627CC|nr:hypothetical protein [uncultured Desulfobacter sp.]